MSERYLSFTGSATGTRTVTAYRVEFDPPLERREATEIMDVNSQCGNCKHLVREAPGYTCLAFSGEDGVPDDIVFNVFEHTRPYQGQVDDSVLYDPIDPAYPTGFTS